MDATDIAMRSLELAVQEANLISGASGTVIALAWSEASDDSRPAPFRHAKFWRSVNVAMFAAFGCCAAVGPLVTGKAVGQLSAAARSTGAALIAGLSPYGMIQGLVATQVILFSIGVFTLTCLRIRRMLL